MTRKDYELIARTIREEKDLRDNAFASATLRTLTSRFAGVLATDNPRFDPGRFTSACGF